MEEPVDWNSIQEIKTEFEILWLFNWLRNIDELESSENPSMTILVNIFVLVWVMFNILLNKSINVIIVLNAQVM